MKKIALLVLATPLLFASSSFAADANMSNEEFKRVVCNHLQQNDEVKTAISKAYSEVKSITNNNQKNTLKSMASGEINTVVFCSNINL